MQHILNTVIIIPTYQEVDSITTTIIQLETVINTIIHNKNNKYNIKILIFDSASTDGTQEKITQLQNSYNNIILISESQPSGLGSAYRQAMRYALLTLHADIIFEYDADGSHQAGYIATMLDYLEQGYDVVIGSRYVKNGRLPENWPLKRRLLSILGNKIARLFLTQQYYDLSSGFRATRANILKQIPYDQLISKNYAYKFHLVWLLHQAGANIIEIPIHFLDRQTGYSKFPKFNILESLWVVFRLRFQAIYRYLKLCCTGLCGLIIQLIIFNLLRHIVTAPPIFANIIAIELAIITNFMINHHWVFKDRRDRSSIIARFLRFNLASLGSLIIQSLILSFTIVKLGTGFIVENSMILLGVFLGSLWNYYSYSYWVWCVKNKP